MIETSTPREVAAQLWQAVTTGTSVLTSRMTDPDARLSDVAQALRVVAARAKPQVMPNGEVLDFEERERQAEEDRRLAQWLYQIESATDEELAEYLANGGLTQLRDASRGAFGG